jgi:hypothetical protein
MQLSQQQNRLEVAEIVGMVPGKVLEFPGRVGRQRRVFLREFRRRPCDQKFRSCEVACDADASRNRDAVSATIISRGFYGPDQVVRIFSLKRTM